MSGGSKSSEHGGDQRRWWLCSHLVEVEREEPSGATDTGVLEEIRDDGIRVAVDDPRDQGQSLRVKADGFEHDTIVTACSQRETDYLVELWFADGFRWTPDAWTPQHLSLPETEKPKAKRVSSGS